MARKILIAISALALVASANAVAYAGTKIANGELTGNIGIVSNYIFRGISNSDNHPAFQGGLDYTHNSGFYVGTWGSSVDFDDGDEASVEWDLYGGYATTWNGFTFDGKYLYYFYPGVDGPLGRAYNYWELQGVVSYTLAGVDLNTGLAWANDFFGASGDGLYVQAGASIPFLQYFSLETHIGRQSIDDNAKFGAPSYADWSLGVSASYEGLTLGAYYVDTNLSKNDCFGGTSWCDARGIVSLRYAF